VYVRRFASCGAAREGTDAHNKKEREKERKSFGFHKAPRFEFCSGTTFIVPHFAAAYARSGKKAFETENAFFRQLLLFI
jgi:hypothetical protein